MLGSKSAAFDAGAMPAAAVIRRNQFLSTEWFQLMNAPLGGGEAPLMCEWCRQPFANRAAVPVWCERCNAVPYCSSACRERAWSPHHRAECDVYIRWRPLLCRGLPRDVAAAELELDAIWPNAPLGVLVAIRRTGSDAPAFYFYACGTLNFNGTGNAASVEDAYATVSSWSHHSWAAGDGDAVDLPPDEGVGMNVCSPDGYHMGVWLGGFAGSLIWRWWYHTAIIARGLSAFRGKAEVSQWRQAVKRKLLSIMPTSRVCALRCAAIFAAAARATGLAESFRRLPDMHFMPAWGQVVSRARAQMLGNAVPPPRARSIANPGAFLSARDWWTRGVHTAAQCGWCNANVEGLVTRVQCGRCKVVRYCDEACMRRADALYHGLECALFSHWRDAFEALKPPTPSPSMRVAAQEWLARQLTVRAPLGILIGLEREHSAQVHYTYVCGDMSIHTRNAAEATAIAGTWPRRVLDGLPAALPAPDITVLTPYGNPDVMVWLGGYAGSPLGRWWMTRLHARLGAPLPQYEQTKDIAVEGLSPHAVAALLEATMRQAGAWDTLALPVTCYAETADAMWRGELAGALLARHRASAPVERPRDAGAFLDAAVAAVARAVASMGSAGSAASASVASDNQNPAPAHGCAAETAGAPCWTCFRVPPVGTLYPRCSRCKVVSYCEHACQRRAWETHHKLECPVFQEWAARFEGWSATGVPRSAPGAWIREQVTDGPVGILTIVSRPGAPDRWMYACGTLTVFEQPARDGSVNANVVAAWPRRAWMATSHNAPPNRAAAVGIKSAPDGDVRFTMWLIGGGHSNLNAWWRSEATRRLRDHGLHGEFASALARLYGTDADDQPLEPRIVTALVLTALSDAGVLRAFAFDPIVVTASKKPGDVPSSVAIARALAEAYSEIGED